MYRDELVISQITEIKLSISQFIFTLNTYSYKNECGALDKNTQEFFSFISKQILFIKNIYELYPTYELKVLISDYYNYIISIIKNEQRYIYVNERSIIENYVRWLVKLNVESNHITSDIFELWRNRSKPYLTDDEYALIKSEYTTSCGYIHGSTNLNATLSYVFNECISNIHPLKNPNKYYNKIIRIIKTYNKLIVFTYSDVVDTSFFKRKSLLSYLIGDKNVESLYNLVR